MGKFPYRGIPSVDKITATEPSEHTPSTDKDYVKVVDNTQKINSK